ncbi:hypothetical protein [Virgibacillus halodenitrificans]|uniref:hypothetical protein n=1 Tax=Virgibacillus halodenitrificans TaxID=1482 RepID=UPI0002E4172B|nr:hypothetical protein [Virgibacillus halodenitrificans]
MKVTQKTAFVGQKEVQYTHIENESTVVCFMFSGAGYVYDKPLFYYSTMTMLQHQYDIVHIHYSYEQDLFELPLDKITNIIINDVNPVISNVLQDKQYHKTLFLGKSLGTIPLINGLIKNNLYLNSKMILLTPLLKFDSTFKVLMEMTHSSLIIIGTNDPHYIPSKVRDIENRNNIQIEKVLKANHSLDLEPFNTLGSIRCLERIMKQMDDFLLT